MAPRSHIRSRLLDLRQFLWRHTLAWWPPTTGGQGQDAWANSISHAEPAAPYSRHERSEYSARNPRLRCGDSALRGDCNLSVAGAIVGR
jgi:hypothetical protein